MIMFPNVHTLLVILFPLHHFLSLVSSHGRFLEPPNRSSLWRFPEFGTFEPPKNYEDNQLFCGGVAVQHGLNGGKCGECGDPYNNTRPRDNENGGTYGRGLIVRNYTAGQWIDIHVEITAFHWGHFEIRLCPLERVPGVGEARLYGYEKEGCFESPLNPLFLSNLQKEWPLTDEHQTDFHFQAKLPDSLRSCERCVLQWHYLTGNSWGFCPNGTEMAGCGPQETFRGCSDVAILPA